MLRNPRGSAPGWVGLRNKELVPLKLFADHLGISDDDLFLLRPEGDPVDAQIIASSRTLALQFTLAAPSWGPEDGPNENSGYQQHQIMRALNENEVVVDYPPFASEDGIATGQVCSISDEDRDRACRKGLTSAIARKALYDGCGSSPSARPRAISSSRPISRWPPAA